MRKHLSAIVLLLASLLFSQNVFAYPECDSNLTVPCSYPGIGFDFNVVYADTYGDYYFANSNHVQFVDYNNAHYTADTVPWGYAYSVQNDNGFEGLAFYNHALLYRVSSNGFQWFYSPPENYYRYVPFPTTASLTVSRSPEAGGGVASSDDEIQCGYNSNNYCQVVYPLDSEVELEAYPNTGYAFAYWEWNEGASSSTNNPETFTIDGALGVVAKFVRFLKWPLSGTPWNRTILSEFGDDWLDSCGGLVRKHTGIDIVATETETVYAAEDGVVKVAQLDQTWGGWVTIEHNSSSNPYTTTYIHIAPSVSVNDAVDKGDPIGTVIDYGGSVHLHFGLRNGAYSNTSNRGRLPQTVCDGDPAYPENFEDPTTVLFE